LLGLAFVSLVALGCGGGDDEEGGSSAGSGGSGSGGAAAGAGGAGAGAAGSTTTGTSGAGGAGGTMAAPVTCGTATCMPTGSRFLQACCVDMAMGTCGTKIAFGGTGMCNAPVDPDPRCESVMAMSLTIPSCCTDMNRCGISFAMLGMPGCLSLDEAAMIAAGDGGTPDGGMPMSMNPFMIDLPMPKACQ
jgi:hypothetical protein